MDPVISVDSPASPKETLARLDRSIRSRTILEHPFYRAWSAGELTRTQLRTYARSYYPHVAAFPGHLETAAAGASDPEIRAELESNLAEELSEPKAHPELWLDFAEGLGLERREVEEAAAPAETRAAVASFARLTAGGTAGALAALYAYESQQPEVSQRKAEGLRDFYDIDDPAALAYFEVHAEADVRHRDGERRALERALAGGAGAGEVLAAASEALDAYWGLLDGVCRQAGIPTTC